MSLSEIKAKIAQKISSLAAKLSFSGGEEGRFKPLFAVLAVLISIIIGLGFYWSAQPQAFSVRLNAAEKLALTNSNAVVGSVTTAAMIEVAETLLHKPGGYISNDMLPPGLYLDNISNWEFGALVQLRDLARAFREDFSRSQSQSSEDPDLIISEPKFNFDSESWILPSTESEYGDAVVSLYSYLERISDPQITNAQFYARADNLASWLSAVESRLGSLSQRLSASVRQRRVNTDTAGDLSATQSTPISRVSTIQTPWLQVDDIFYEARGATWALMHFLKAVEVDFQQVLEGKNAMASLQQIIRELEAGQRTVMFPFILNGSGFGLFANHSLSLANYVSRANAAIIDLRSLLEQG
ncbi:MAG: hypothetical protein COC19_00280 [SAR86 cluster bacterium]|uniref:DUF2333 domain-containing protein n=1 Tax=SAR86 cluster bacterium TaxID=2030880 RepID=A0A2A4MW30_9GAMM|nr:MAG: hypothetical protein COC19_00280 [SAR86 cluster bacterium]